MVMAACTAMHAVRAADDARPSFAWHLPPGFPQPAVPSDNPMSAPKVALGRRLFFETRLSITGQYSCASCHRPELAYTDGKPHAVGATGEQVRRSALSLANVAYNPAFTWGNSRIRSLEAQMRQPLFSEHPLEMGLSGDGAAALTALALDTTYIAQFGAAFSSDAPLTMEHVIQAIAAFERTLISGRSPFDRYVFDDDRSALSESAKRGMALFYSPRGGCSQCHFGINFSGPIVYEGHAKADAIYANTGLYDVDGRGSYPAGDQGLMEITHRAQDMGKFRVPTLRNVGLTAPYMHDGSLSSLDAVLDHYVQGGHHGPRQDPKIRRLVLAAGDRKDLIAFLVSLTDQKFARNP
jgi:cytochrome c peroxidase